MGVAGMLEEKGGVKASWQAVMSVGFACTYQPCGLVSIRDGFACTCT